MRAMAAAPFAKGKEQRAGPTQQGLQLHRRLWSPSAPNPNSRYAESGYAAPTASLDVLPRMRSRRASMSWTNGVWTICESENAAAPARRCRREPRVIPRSPTVPKGPVVPPARSATARARLPAVTGPRDLGRKARSMRPVPVRTRTQAPRGRTQGERALGTRAVPRC